MLTKVYVGVLAAATIIMAVLTAYAHSWLGSIGLPAAAFEGYRYNADAGLKLLIVSWATLLVLATAIAWADKRAWPLWAGLIYFTLFSLALFFWLDRESFEFQRKFGLDAARFTFGAIMGSAMIIGAGIVTFCVHFMVSQLRRRMSMSEPISEEPDEKPEDQKSL